MESASHRGVFSVPEPMICADGWHEDVYEAYKRADILVQPSFGEDVDEWDKPWPSGKGATNGDEKLTEGQAWTKYALQGRMSTTSARYGVTIFLAGQLWDIKTGGRSVLVVKLDPKAKPATMEAPDMRKGCVLKTNVLPKEKP